MKIDSSPSAIVAEAEFDRLVILSDDSDVLIERVHIADEITMTLRSRSQGYALLVEKYPGECKVATLAP